MKQCKTASYLGDVLCETGKIDNNIIARSQKAIGITCQIMSILKSISLGIYYFNVAFTLRNAMFLNGILTSCEIWPFLNKKNIYLLESADQNLLRRFFNSPITTPIVSYYLEAGKLQIQYILIKRRLIYLWNILKRQENDLVKKYTKYNN